jgi:hypothetical protein
MYKTTIIMKTENYHHQQSSARFIMQTQYLLLDYCSAGCQHSAMTRSNDKKASQYIKVVRD